MSKKLKLRIIAENPNAKSEHLGVTILRKLLRAARWDDQGGYVSFSNGMWTSGMGIGAASAEELPALFDLVGIVPDEIKTLGSCDTCAHAKDGQERGYTGACSPCKRPQHSNWIPLFKRDDIDRIEVGRALAERKHGTCDYAERHHKGRFWMVMIRPGVFWCGMCGIEITIKTLTGLKSLSTAPANVKRALKVIHERNAAKRNA